MISYINHDKSKVHRIPKSNSTKKDALMDTHFYVIEKMTVVSHLSCEKKRPNMSPVSKADISFFCKTTSRPHC